MQAGRGMIKNFTMHGLLFPKHNHNTLIPHQFVTNYIIVHCNMSSNVTMHIPRFWYEQENECIVIKTLVNSKIIAFTYFKLLWFQMRMEEAWERIPGRWRPSSKSTIQRFESSVWARVTSKYCFPSTTELKWHRKKTINLVGIYWKCC